MSFIETFTQLCNEKGKAPTAVCTELGLSDAIYSYWRKNGSVPRPAVLQKISEYFGVTVDSLTGTTPMTKIITNSINESPNSTLTIHNELSKQEKELIALYREFGIEEQYKLLKYAFELRGDN